MVTSSFLVEPVLDPKVLAKTPEVAMLVTEGALMVAGDRHRASPTPLEPLRQLFEDGGGQITVTLANVSA